MSPHSGQQQALTYANSPKSAHLVSHSSWQAIVCGQGIIRARKPRSHVHTEAPF